MWDNAAAKSPAVRNLLLQCDQLLIEGGVLYRKKVSNVPGEHLKQVVVPRAMQKDVLQNIHNTLMSAHLGVKKTLSRIKQDFYGHRIKESERDRKVPTVGPGSGQVGYQPTLWAPPWTG